MHKQVKIVLIDDHQLVIDGVSSMLTEAGYNIAGTALNVEQGKEAINRNEPDIVICDVHMPNQRGTEIIRWLKEQKPWIKIIVLSMCDDRTTVSELASLGVNAYLLKSVSIDDFKTAIEKILSGRFHISEEVADVLMAKVEGEVSRKLLTKREEEVVRLMLNELPNKEIADKLFISERTVEAHRRNIYRKTSTSSIVGLMKWALENNIYIL
ncbi:MAG: response regulator transcription factor [Bacteroidales bacterium]